MAGKMTKERITPSGQNKRASLTRFAWLSIVAAVSTITLKAAAYLLTGSVGLLSDAIESLINLIAGVMALWMLTIAARPPDESHLYGHSKAEYFASTVEGGLILAAAISIFITAIERMMAPKPLEQVGLGLSISILASLINFGVARVLLTAGKKYNSITLEADAHHLMTDVWTSVGVLAGVSLVAVTGWLILDPIVALLVAANIVWTAISLLRRSIAGLMDASLPDVDQKKIEGVLETYRQKKIGFHALLTRQAAARKFVSVHVLVPGEMTVHDAHHLAEDIERDIRQAVGEASVITHLEPIDDEVSDYDISLDRA